jgi:hypothetical protein
MSSVVLSNVTGAGPPELLASFGAPELLASLGAPELLAPLDPPELLAPLDPPEPLEAPPLVPPEPLDPTGVAWPRVPHAATPKAKTTKPVRIIAKCMRESPASHRKARLCGGMPLDYY